VPNAEVHAGGSGIAAIKVDSHPPCGTYPDRGKESKTMAGGSSRKASKGQDGPIKEQRGPSITANPPKRNLNSLQSLIPGPSTPLVSPKDPLSPLASSPSPKACTLL
jgi:hypothetical protein